jgi:hypothetical protein
LEEEKQVDDVERNENGIEKWGHSFIAMLIMMLIMMLDVWGV